MMQPGDFRGDAPPAGFNHNAAKAVFLTAGACNLVAALALIVAPGAVWRSAGFEDSTHTGAYVAVAALLAGYGIAYLCAARRPLDYWPMAVGGFFSSCLFPAGFLLSGSGPLIAWPVPATVVASGLIIAGGVVWCAAFATVLCIAFRWHANSQIGEPHDIDDAMMIFASHQGRTLKELSDNQPVMLVFLRHFGCSFCREALQDLAASKDRIEETGIALALVYMSRTAQGESFTRRYGLDSVEQFSDGTCELYCAFGLDRGKFAQVFGPKVLWRGLRTMFRGNFIGALAGDSFRMPGVALLHRGELHGFYKHQNVADRPDYVGLAQQLASASHDSGSAGA